MELTNTPAPRIITTPAARKPYNVQVCFRGEWTYVGCYSTRAAAERRCAAEAVAA